MKREFNIWIFIALILCFIFTLAFYLFRNWNTIFPKHPKLSVIVPVYNVEPYLSEALDSVINQTYKDMEIICVNDGSTDNSPSILNEYAKKDSRIKIINQENQGLSEARNVGLRASVGDYIYFFDSDDILAPYALEKSITLLEEYDADASEFAIKEFNYNEHIDTSLISYTPKPVDFMECKQNENPFEVYGFWPVSAWRRVYKRSFLIDNNLEFKKGLRTQEDVLFNYISKACMKKFVRDSNIGYYYRDGRPGSIMNTDCKVVTKRLDGFLIIVQELALNRSRFKFPGSDEYLLDAMLNLVHEDISGFEDQNIKQEYAQKAYEYIGPDFVEKYKVNVSKGNSEKLSDLKKWAKV